MAQRINLTACCACTGREEMQSIFPSPCRAVVAGLGSLRRWNDGLLQRGEESLFPDKQIKGRRWLVPARKEENLVNAAGPAAVTCSEQESLDGLIILRFLAAAREGSAPPFLRKSYIFALKEQWLTDLPLWGVCACSQGIKVLFAGDSQTNLAKEMQKEGSREKHTYIQHADFRQV